MHAGFFFCLEVDIHSQPVAKSVQCKMEEKDSSAIATKIWLQQSSDWRQTNKDIHELEYIQHDLTLF